MPHTSHFPSRRLARAASAALALVAAAGCQDRPTTAAVPHGARALVGDSATSRAADPVTVSVTMGSSDAHTYFSAPNAITLQFIGASRPVTATLVPGVTQSVRLDWSALVRTGPYGQHPDPGEYHCASGFDETSTFTYTVTVNGVTGTMTQPVRMRWICNNQAMVDIQPAGPVTFDLGDGQVVEVRQPLRQWQFLGCATGPSCFGGGGAGPMLDLLLVADRNTAPVADAGADRSAALANGSAAVALDGSASADADGDALTYAWSGDFQEGTATGATPTVHFTTTGTHEVTLTVSDGSLSSTDRMIVTVGDGSPPAISYTLTPATPDGANGWYTGSVSLAWTVSEPESPETISRTGCVDQAIAADQAKTTYSCAASSSGGAAATVSVTIGRDATAPAVVGATSPASPDGEGGWYRSAVRVSWTCSDATSGIASCPPAVMLGEATGTQQATGTATDHAGHASSASVSGIFVDLTDPTVTCGATPNFLVGASGTVTAAVSDAASGPVAATVSAAANTATPGERTVTLTGRDRAGRSTTVACAYRVQYGFEGFFQPVSNDGTNTLKAGQALPIKWRVTAAGGAPVLDLAGATVSVRDAGCALGSTADQAREVAAGTSGLQNLGDGYYQFNWKTPASYARSCKVVRVELGDGVTHSFQAAFTK